YGQILRFEEKLTQLVGNGLDGRVAHARQLALLGLDRDYELEVMNVNRHVRRVVLERAGKSERLAFTKKRAVPPLGVTAAGGIMSEIALHVRSNPLLFAGRDRHALDRGEGA